MQALYNDFHGTTATVRPRDGIISERAWKRAAKALCGVPDCQCGVVRGYGAPDIAQRPDGNWQVMR